MSCRGCRFWQPKKKKRKNIFASKTNDKSCQKFFFGNPAPILSRSEEVVHLRKKFHRSTVGFTSNGGVFDKRGAGFQKSKCYFHFGCSSSKHKNLDNLLLENFVEIACASTARSTEYARRVSNVRTTKVEPRQVREGAIRSLTNKVWIT